MGCGLRPSAARSARGAAARSGPPPWPRAEPRRCSAWPPDGRRPQPSDLHIQWSRLPLTECSRDMARAPRAGPGFFRRHNDRDCRVVLVAFGGPARGPDVNGASERCKRAARCDRAAAQRPAVFPPHLARAVPGAVGGSRADRPRRCRRVRHAAPAGQASACPDGLLRPGRLLGPALRGVGIQAAAADPPSALQPLAVTPGLDADPGRHRPGNRAGAVAVARPGAPSSSAAPADAHANSHVRADARAHLDALA